MECFCLHYCRFSRSFGARCLSLFDLFEENPCEVGENKCFFCVEPRRNPRSAFFCNFTTLRRQPFLEPVSFVDQNLNKWRVKCI